MDDTQEISDKAHWPLVVLDWQSKKSFTTPPLLYQDSRNLDISHGRPFQILRSQSEIDIPPDGSPDCNRALGNVQES